MKNENKSVFETLSAIDVSKHIEKKQNLSYLPWAWAWAEVKKRYPSASYKIRDTEADENLGYMCHTEVTIDNETLEMWLPVMDGKNKSMKKEKFSYKNKYNKEFTVEAATTFDINKTIMRCLVKNIAMFGLGLYIYLKEDSPTDDTTSLLDSFKLNPFTKIAYDRAIKAIESGDSNKVNLVAAHISRCEDSDLKSDIENRIIEFEASKL